jgi:hypothetical protein
MIETLPSLLRQERRGGHVQRLSFPHRPLAGAGAVLALALTGCGGSSTPPPSGSPAATAAAAASTMPTAGAAAIALIKEDWAAFFDPKTDVGRRVALLQNGPAFRAALSAQAGTPLANEASARVATVTLSAATGATVVYDILLGGQPVLRNQIGTAVYESGTWKVGAASFCGLLSLENSGNKAAMPGACHVA